MQVLSGFAGDIVAHHTHLRSFRREESIRSGNELHPIRLVREEIVSAMNTTHGSCIRDCDARLKLPILRGWTELFIKADPM